MTINVRQVLLAANAILDKGDRYGSEYFYRGLFASTDFDGYTVVLRDNDVQIKVFFHQKYDLKFESSDALDKFQDKVSKLTH